MVARLIEGFESSTTPADYLGKWSAFGAGVTISSAAGRFGNGARGTGSSHNWNRLFDSQATWVVGFALRLSALPATACPVVAFLDSAVVHCGLAVEAATGLLFAWRGTTATVLGTASGGISPGTWAFVEVKVTINDTTGIFHVRLNGAPVLTLNSQDTRNAGNASANTVRLGTTSTVGANADFDDVYVFDATGSANADFAGDCRVEQVLPAGAGATTAWTPSAGSNWQCVDDVPPNSDTDYVSSATAAQTDTYACGDLSVATSGTVKCVQASVLARKDDAGSRSLALVARPGSTDRVGGTQALTTTYARYAELWNTNPDTSAAWSVGEVGASEFGVRLIA